MTKDATRRVLVTVLATGGMLAGASGGCSTETQPIEVGFDAAADVVVEADARRDEEDARASPIPCPSTNEIDATTFPWNPPTRLPGSCTEAELDAFVKHVAANDDPAKWKAGAWTDSEACRSCVFAKDGATWAPLVENASGQLAVVNIGGCVAIASGREACGRAAQQWRDCYVEACSDCSTGEKDWFQKCSELAKVGACKKAFDALVPSCGDAQTLAAAEAACDGATFVFEGPIRAQCIGLTDGGDL